MFVRALVFAVCAALASPAAAEVADCSRAEPLGGRTLCHEAVIAAPASAVWALFSTDAGLRSWLAPVAAIELRVGGGFETSYDASRGLGDPGNIRNRVVAFTPESLLVIQVAQAPPGFAHADAVRELTTVIALEPIDDARTRVRVSMLGYREGAAFDDLYTFFARGNAWTLNQLIARAANGPTAWTEH